MFVLMLQDKCWLGQTNVQYNVLVVYYRAIYSYGSCICELLMLQDKCWLGQLNVQYNVQFNVSIIVYDRSINSYGWDACTDAAG